MIVAAVATSVKQERTFAKARDMLQDKTDTEHLNRPEDGKGQKKLRIVMLTVQVLACAVLIYKIVRSARFVPEENVVMVTMDILCVAIASIFSLSLMRTGKQNPVLSAFLWLFDSMCG